MVAASLRRLSSLSFISLFAVCALAGILAGCGSGKTVVTVSPATVTLDAGKTQVFTATATHSDQGVSWSISPNVGTLTSATTTSVTYTAPTTITAATTVTLTATSVKSSDATATAKISLVAEPTITTTSLPSGTVGTAYSATLTGAGGIAPYTWAITSGSLPAGLSLASGTGVISGTPSAAGTSDFTVQLTDSNNVTATANLSIVIAAPPPLSITTTSLPSGTVGVGYSATLSAMGGVTPYTWSISSGTLPAGLSLNTSTGVISGTPTTVGVSSFTVKVTDAESDTATANLSITINPAPLMITTTSLPSGTVGTAYSATLTATGGVTPYTWSISSGSLPAGLMLNTSTGVISGTPTTAETSSFTVKVTDSQSNTATANLSILVNPPPLMITTTSLPSGTVGITYSATLAATGGAPPYTWSISSGSLPPGLSLNASTGVISGTPTQFETASFTVKVTDSDSNTATANLSILINSGLSVTTTSLPAATVGIAYSATLTATGGTTPYTWSISSGSVPAGLTLNASSGVISGTPTTAETSSFTVKVTDSEPTPATATANLSLLVNPAALMITTTSLPSGTINVPYSATVTATGGVTPYTWSISVGSLPPGLSLNTSTGVISGTPTAIGTTDFTVKVTDSASHTATAPLSITISASNLMITTTSLPNGTVGMAYSATVTATGGATPYTWSISSGSLPTGLMLNASSGVISGTPTTVQTASFTVKVTDADSNTATANLSITINPATLMITTTSLPSGTINIAYSATVTATGGVTPYTWSISSGSLPTGLMLNTSTGVISGTPTATGTFSFTVKVTDADSNTATANLSITINATLMITTTSLPNGAVNDAYSSTLTATGGVTPYTWSISSGSLPAGLMLNSSTGVISGTPTTAETSSFTVKVTDADSNMATANLSIMISAQLVITTTSPLPSGTVGTAYSFMLGAVGGTAPYTWSITAGSLPAGLSLSTAGLISGTPTTVETSSFTVEVKDSSTPQQTASAPLSLTINAATLMITTTSLPNGTVGTAYSATVMATGGVTPYAWSISSGSLPAGLSINTSTGVISGTPTTAETSSFTVKVTDADSDTATANLSITINASSTLTIITTSLPSGTLNVAYSTTLAATGGVSPYTWSISSGTLPAGLSLTASTGVIAGTPTTVGTSAFTIKVTDADSNTATANVSIQIYSSLTITTRTLPGGMTGVAYSATLAASGGTTPYTWALVTGSLPSGFTLSSAGVISGTTNCSCENGQAFVFEVSVTDSENPTVTVMANFNITINGASLNITTNSLASGSVGTAYSETLSAVNGTPPYTWSIASGALPAGLTLATSGAITGTPSATGTSRFVVQVTDADSDQAQKTESITIYSAGLQVTTTSLQYGNVGIAYSTSLNASGGTPPYTWSVTSGSLPAGLSLGTAGSITGTPTTVQTATFTLQVKDSASNTATASLSLEVFSVAACPSGSESQLNGTYAAVVQGFYGSGLGYPQGAAFSITANGSGLITSGEMDVNLTNPQQPGHSMANISSGTYSVGSNGRGCMTVELASPAEGTFTFAFVLGDVVSGVAEFGHIIEYDDTTGSGARMTGDIVKQKTADFSLADLSSNFAYAIRGFDSSVGRFAFAGSLTNSATGVFSNVYGDINDSGTTSTNLSGGTGGFSGTPDTFGRLTASITINATTYNYIAYIVNPDEVFLLSSDPVATNPNVVGTMLATSSSFTTGSISGNYILEAGGADATNSGNSVAILALFNSNGSGTWSANVWQYELNGSGSNQGAPQTSGGSYTVGSSSGRVALTGGGGHSPAVYLTNNSLGIAAIIIDLDVGPGTPAFIGSVLVQPSGTYDNTSVSGNFIVYSPGMGSNQEDTPVGFSTLSDGQEVDIVNDSTPDGLFGGIQEQSQYTINADGSGTAGDSTSQNTLLLTNGSTVFLMDVGGGQAQVIELDQQ